MEGSEIEFLCEGESVEIVPNFSSGVLYLLAGDVGPFQGGVPVQVPLWMALNLRSRGKCRIVEPEWMNSATLQRLKEAEKENQFFNQLPQKDIFSISQLILDVGKEDISDSHNIRTLFKDIWDIRQSKLRKSVDAFVQSGMFHAQLDHLSLIELNSIRPLLNQVLKSIHQLEMAPSSNNSTINNSSSSSSFNTNSSSARY